MQLNQQTNSVRKSEDFGESTFRIAAGAKAFDILSNNLYSNKIRAIVRELSCNAYDAHKEAGTEDVPFIVTLPNAFQRNFKIRDFGTGISPEDIANIYTVYFASTKTDSNDFVGCLGLGSKTPFSYTDMFTVTSFYNGIKYVYSAFKNDHGEPSIAKISEVATDEPNGIEVQLAVKESDFQKFYNEAAFVYSWWFNKLPTIENANINLRKATWLQEGNGWKISNDPFFLGPKAVMGNVCYSISESDLTDHIQDSSLLDLMRLLKPVLEFPIGALIPSPNRETLSYQKRTIKAIEKRLEDLKNTIDKQIESSLDKEKNRWDANLKLQEIENSNLRDYTRRNSIKILYKGSPIKSGYNLEDIIQEAGLSIKRPEYYEYYYRHSWRSGTTQTSCNTQYAGYRDYRTHQAKDKVIYIFVDTTQDRKFSDGGFRAWMRHFEDEYKGTNFYVFNDGSGELRDAIIETIGLTEDETYYFWHKMPKKPKTPRVASKGTGRKKEEAKLLDLEISYKINVNVTDQWNKYETIDLENGEGFYLPRHQYYAYETHDHKRELNLATFASMIKHWNDHVDSAQLDPSFKVEKVFGFTKTQVKNVGDGWKNAVDHFRYLGPLAFTKKLQKSIFLKTAKISNERMDTLRFVMEDLPELSSVKIWQDFQSNIDDIMNVGHYSNLQSFVDKWAKFYTATSTNKDGVWRLEFKVSEEEFKDLVDNIQKSITLVWNSYPILEMFWSLNEHEIRYGSPANIQQLKHHEAVIEYLKLKENL